MIYRNGYSILGYGCMRLPGNDAEAEKLIMKAYEEGINYFDTAYVYKGKEEQLGKILAKNNIRDKVQIATKLPVYLIKKPEQFDEFFDEELKRLQTDYVDNYLMHMLPDETTWKRLLDMGIGEWLEKKKAAGQIKKIGFSFHGSTDIFLKILDAYDWEFCLVQYNYLDENAQAGRQGVEEAARRGIPVFIMEPLRGGKLTKGLNKKAKAIVEKSDKTAGEWGLSWLYAQDTVSCVLSGMETMDVLEENLRIANNTHEYTEKDYETIEKIKAAINSKKNIPCTGCNYCMPCPFGVDIPGCFKCYNTSYNDGYIAGETEYVMALTLKEETGFSSQCKKCGKCEKVCPQHIPIRDSLKKVKRRLEPPFFIIIKKVAAHFYKRGNL
ncbi:MAG: aldo/keto reductase [Eubacterium sp.]|nr:aldo/keto reductase [Eubacterium sp.]